MIRRLLVLVLALLGGSVSLPARASAQLEATSAGSIRVVHAPRQRVLAREVLDAATRPMPLPGFAPSAAPESTTIVLAPSPDAFRDATGGMVPEWAGGVAIPGERIIVLPAYPSPGVRQQEAAVTLRHELAHLALHERLPGPIPRWFDEGYAELASGSWDVENAWKLRVAFLLGRAPPLDSLTLAWPRGSERARLAYLLSATAVDHLRRRGGEEGFALLLENWRRDGSLERAVRSTFGLTMGQLEDEWGREVRRRYGWLFAASSVGLVWFVAMTLTLLAWIPRRRRNRARMDAMRAEERMLPPVRPDFWEIDYPIAEEARD